MINHIAEPVVREFEIIPEGNYKVLVESYKEGFVKNDMTKRRVNFTLKISDGQYTNRKIFLNIWLDHLNETCRHIGKKYLNLFADVMNKSKITHLDELINAQMLVKIKVKKDDKGEDRNDVIDIYKLSQMFDESGKPVRLKTKTDYSQPLEKEDVIVKHNPDDALDIPF